MNSITHSQLQIGHGVVLSTPRMVLRAMHDDDMPTLHERVFSVSEVMKWVFSGKIFLRAESELFMRENFSVTPLQIGLAVLADKTTGEILGFAGLNRCDVLSADDLEIGFVLAREAWGRGLATEIGHAQLDFGFRRLRRGRLLALAAFDNEGSIRTLEKLGMRYHSDVCPADRAPRQVFWMHRDEWSAAQSE